MWGLISDSVLARPECQNRLAHSRAWQACFRSLGRGLAVWAGDTPFFPGKNYAPGPRVELCRKFPTKMQKVFFFSIKFTVFTLVLSKIMALYVLQNYKKVLLLLLFGNFLLFSRKFVPFKFHEREKLRFRESCWYNFFPWKTIIVLEIFVIAKMFLPNLAKGRPTCPCGSAERRAALFFHRAQHGR